MRSVLSVDYRRPTLPPISAEINENHPLAKGLRGFWIFDPVSGELTANLVTGIKDTLTNDGAHSGVPTPFVGQGEPGIFFDRSNGCQMKLTPAARYSPGFPATLAGRINPNSLYGNQTLWGTRCRDNTAAANGLYMWLNPSGTLLCDAGQGGGTGASNLRRRASSVNLSLNTWYTLGCSYRSLASDFSVYIDGVDRTGGSAGTAATFENSTGVPAVGLRQASTTISYGDIRYQWFGIWERALEPEEHRILHLNPFSIFSSDTSRSFWIPTTGPLGQSVAFGKSAETDTAHAFTWTRKLAFGKATETDTAPSASAAKRMAFGKALETDTGRGFTAAKRLTFGQATETDTAYSFSQSQGFNVGQAAELDVAYQITWTKLLAFGKATEASAAYHFTAHVGTDAVPVYTKRTRASAGSAATVAATGKGRTRTSTNTGVTDA